MVHQLLWNFLPKKRKKQFLGFNIKNNYSRHENKSIGDFN